MRGGGHRSASARKETTSTAAAAPANSDSGIGRFARWIRPCAPAAAGHASAAVINAAAIPACRRVIDSSSALDHEDRAIGVRARVDTASHERAALVALARVALRLDARAQVAPGVRARRLAGQLIGLDVVALALDR